MTSISNPGTAQVLARVTAALFGGYGFTWGCTALSAVLLFAAGMDLTEANGLANLLGFVLYLVVFCWAFAARRLRRVWAVLAGGGTAAWALAWWLAGRLA
jgi:hypothetical protein